MRVKGTAIRFTAGGDIGYEFYRRPGELMPLVFGDHDDGRFAAEKVASGLRESGFQAFRTRVSFDAVELSDATPALNEVPF